LVNIVFDDDFEEEKVAFVGFYQKFRMSLFGLYDEKVETTIVHLVFVSIIETVDEIRLLFLLDRENNEEHP
jgi:hypothetical protein